MTVAGGQYCSIRNWQRGVLMAFLAGMVSISMAVADESLRLVTFSFRPYMSVQQDKPSGVLVEIVREAFGRMEQPMTIEILPPGRAWNMFVSGQVDGAFTMKMRAERKETMLFTTVPLVTHEYVFFVRKGSKVRFEGDLATLGSYRIGSVISLTYGEKFERAVKSGVIRNVEPLPSLEQNFKKLMAGRVDLVVSSRLVGFDILQSMGLLNKIEVAGPPIESLPAYLVFKRGVEYEEIARRFDQVLSSMLKDGTIARIYRSHDLESR